MSDPTTSASFESFVLSVLRCLPHAPFGASLEEHPLLPLHDATPSTPTRSHALVVPADRVRNATSSLVEFFCLLCTVFVAACTVCSAATVFSLLRRRSAAQPSDLPEQPPQPPLCIAVAAGDVVVALNKTDEIPTQSVVFDADTEPCAVYPARPLTSSMDDACPGRRRRLFIPRFSPTLASVEYW